MNCNRFPQKETAKILGVLFRWSVANCGAMALSGKITATSSSSAMLNPTSGKDLGLSSTIETSRAQALRRAMYPKADFPS